jgi:drug/metabolite transporter (DMT)-like permease
MAIWSTNFIIGRELRDALTPGTIAAFRALVAGVPMGVWILSTHEWPRAGHRLLGPMVGLGLLGIVASQYLTYLALHWSLATNVIILNAGSPLVTATIAILVGAAPFSPGLFKGLLISVAGAFLVTAFGASGGARLEADPGALLIIATMVTWGFYNLGVQRMSLTLSPLVVTSGAMLAGFPFLVPLWRSSIRRISGRRSARTCRSCSISRSALRPSRTPAGAPRCGTSARTTRCCSTTCCRCSGWSWAASCCTSASRSCRSSHPR